MYTHDIFVLCFLSYYGAFIMHVTMILPSIAINTMHFYAM
uniref:Uncharacterized protein n=1 Tax=Anguilla anguilla TaxID=7936 RepID=A0A0E9WHV9_ANGAN